MREAAVFGAQSAATPIDVQTFAKTPDRESRAAVSDRRQSLPKYR